MPLGRVDGLIVPLGATAALPRVERKRERCDSAAAIGGEQAERAGFSWKEVRDQELALLL